MAYTRHGYHIPGTTRVAEIKNVTDCGGVDACPQCRREVGDYHFDGLWIDEPVDRARKFVHSYVSNHNAGNARFEVALITYMYILGGWKAFLTTDISDGKVYEVIYKQAEDRLIMNVYGIQDNFHITF